MYILELIFKLIEDFKNKKPAITENDTDAECDHVFLPVDSTKKVFACTKCGIIKKDL